jgi:hypothetical protein
MDAETVFYLLHWGVVVGALAVSWWRARHVLHPHFIFTMMFCVFLSDFLVRGYDVNNDPDSYRQRLDHILPADVYYYQVLILAAIAIILFAALFVRRGAYERQLFQVAAGLRPDRRMQFYAIGLSSVLTLGEIVKRLMSVGWSPNEVLMQSLGARGDRDWDRAAWEGHNFIFALSSAFMPLCAVLAGYLIVCGRGAARFAAVPVFVIVMFLLVTDGSRTPLAIVFGAVWFFAIYRWRSFLARAILTGLASAGVAGTFSLIALFRAIGYTSADLAGDFKFNYQQDDNYYRAIHAFSFADQSNYRWDAFEFFSTIAINPIPRAIWPDKPIIDDQFFGGFKLWWTTDFFFGESVALFGIEWGFVFAILWAVLLYLLFYRALSLLSKPIGIAAYLLVALYVYMCMRSMMSITHFMYLPLAGVVMVLIADRIARRRQHRAIRPRSPAPPGSTHARPYA